MSSQRPTQTRNSLMRPRDNARPCSECNLGVRKVGLSWCAGCLRESNLARRRRQRAREKSA